MKVRAGTPCERIGKSIVQRDGRHLDSDPIVIAPDRARQSRLRDPDQPSGNDHGRCRNSSVTHECFPTPF
jgi:hypothetical protein